MNNTDYLVVLGGGNGPTIFNDIVFYNLATKNWETFPTKIQLPEPMAYVQAVVALKLDNDGCKLMILFSWPIKKLYVCQGNYNWKWIDATGKNQQNQKFVTIGANEMLPCGIGP
jgi:hypothetical protein